MQKIISYILIALTTSLGTKALSQSIRPKQLGPQLVLNNGFEDIKRIPTQWYFKGEDFDAIMKSWESPTLASPDIYTPSTKVPASWAEKGFGKAFPFKGRNMIGLTIYGCGIGKPHCREYVQSQLKEPLVIGQKYYVEMWVKPLLNSVRCDKIGAFFSVFDIKKDFDVRLKCKPQIAAKEVVDTKGGNWIQLESIFTAQTSGKYIVLGNFYTDSLTRITTNGIKEPLNYAYYYFDEISVHKIPPFINTPSEEGTFEDCCIKRGDTILLKNIYFDFDRSTLRPESNIELNKLLHILGEHENMSLNITGHTDVVGRFKYNTWLSRNRATSVKTFLVENGIEEERLKVVAMSFTKPAATNKTDEGRQLNRRVELVVLSE